MEFNYLDPEKTIGSNDFLEVEEFLKFTGRRNIGWHYIVDLTWIYSQAKSWPVGAKVLDAGGGRGPSQFLLAEMGFDIINIDLMQTQPGFAYRRRYGAKRVVLESHMESRYSSHISRFGGYLQLLKRAKKALKNSSLLKESTAAAYAKRHESWRESYGYSSRPVGSIQWLQGNLCKMPEMETASFDAVISLSSLEHIPLELLPIALAEIHRLVRSEGCWAVTTSGTDQADTWYHSPSLGYCFSERDLVKLFDARSRNSVSPSDILRKYHDSQYLKANLARSYRLSGKNGMPWGRWNPVYIPVGISKSLVV
jgi:ubiquinone/menaquinone biosynthesis C-methylase UbiE